MRNKDKIQIISFLINSILISIMYNMAGVDGIIVLALGETLTTITLALTH
nr:MAG TPA: hypothetical protein [Caudoviricetes sp.]